VIISTGTKNLQEQLFYKDIPFLEHALFGESNSGSRLSVCYMKGRNNYLCRKKLYDLTGQPVLRGLEEIEQYRAISAWEKTTGTATGPNSPNFLRPARFGTNWMRAPMPAPDRNAASGTAASSPKCAGEEWKATLSSSIIICSSPISPSSCKPRARPTPASCPKPRP